MNNLPTKEKISKTIYPYLAGLAGGLALNDGWSEKKQVRLEKVCDECSKAVHSLIVRKITGGNND